MNMSIIDRYLNFNNNVESLNNLGIEVNSGILVYNKYYKKLISNPNSVKDYVREQLQLYVNKKYSIINVIGADINYFLEHINLFIKKKFRDLIDEININHIISMLDYCGKDNKNYLDFRNEYYKIVYDNIICGLYKPNGYNEKKKLEDIINDNWSKINFDNLIEFTKTLNKINFLGQNVDDYIKIISDKFDSSENIIKLIDYINKVFFEDMKFTNNNSSNSANSNDSDNSDNFDSDNLDNANWVKESSKYNFRFVVDNLKSNGYLMFEEFNKQIKTKYKKQQTKESIIKDKKLINYFIYIVSKKDSNSVNRQVNEILLKIRDYIYDVEDNFNNNIGYQKITVKQESDKYKSVDLSSYNRSNASFNIFKYSNGYSNPIPQLNISNKIEPYFDIYKAYYNSRYPDREIEFDPFQSTLIVKMNFLEKNYYIHMALIQYIVLDIIYNSQDEINSIKISEKSGIKLEYLQETINSLLQIKIIKRTNGKSIEDLKFYINYNFAHDNNKISISSLVINQDKSSKNEKIKEFLHDRNIIVLSNMYDYIKKNRTFTKDVLITELAYKIPFKINHEQIDESIKTLLEKEHITQITLPNPYNSNSQDTQQIYKFVE
jgi:hypothetical protein